MAISNNSFESEPERSANRISKALRLRLILEEQCFLLRTNVISQENQSSRNETRRYCHHILTSKHVSKCCINPFKVYRVAYDVASTNTCLHRCIDHSYFVRSAVGPDQIDVEERKRELNHALMSLTSLSPYDGFCAYVSNHPIITEDNVLGATKSFFVFDKPALLTYDFWGDEAPHQLTRI